MLSDRLSRGLSGYGSGCSPLLYTCVQEQAKAVTIRNSTYYPLLKKPLTKTSTSIYNTLSCSVLRYATLSITFYTTVRHSTTQLGPAPWRRASQSVASTKEQLRARSTVTQRVLLISRWPHDVTDHVGGCGPPGHAHYSGCPVSGRSQGGRLLYQAKRNRLS